MAVFFQVFMPVAFAALSIYMGTLQVAPAPQTKTPLNLGMYGDILNESLLYSSNGSVADMNPFWQNFSQYANTTVENYDGEFAKILHMLPRWLAVDTEDSFPLHLVAPGKDEVNISLPYKHTRLRFNDSFYHLPPAVINAMSNTLLKRQYPEEEISLSVYPLPSADLKSDFDPSQFTSALFIGIIFVLAPSGLVAEVVQDRENHIKNLLRVNGLTFGLYFATFFTVLGTLMLMTVILIILLIFAFQLTSLTSSAAMGILVVLYLLYVPVSLSYATCASYLFKTMETSQTIFPNVSTLLGMIPYVIVMVCDLFKFGGSTSLATGLHIGFCFVDVLYLPYAILYYINRAYFQCLLNPHRDATSQEEVFAKCSNQPLSAYMTVEIWIIPIAMLVNLIFYFFLLIIIDVKASGGMAADAFPFLKYFEGSKAGEGEEDRMEGAVSSAGDSDVQAEALRVKHFLQNPPATKSPVVLIDGLHKKYASAEKSGRSCLKRDKNKDKKIKTKPAVNSLSFAVEAGEVFGLLGHNGAGKTSTMKVITAEESPTHGRIQVAGHDILSNQSEAFQALGYCPQHDALWPNITVREHLETYATVRGIAPSHMDRVIDLYLRGLQIESHASKYAKDCSGGTRRKLSYAMSMLGRPAIVLLDEPSTGMDPQSKRFLWNTISASFQGERGAILTTHSMEEADALCSRLGIMVKGEMRCLGTGQHLKNRYGTGYLLELKLKSLASETSGLAEQSSVEAVRTERINLLTAFIARLFPSATVQESFEDRVIFNVAQESIVSLAYTFESLEKVREELNVEEYSFSQTTLEQVFIKFAHVQEDDDDIDDSERGAVRL